MSGGGKLERKQAYFDKLIKLLDKYNEILIVEADNVGSSHMQTIRKALRPLDSVVLMGKNTLIRKAIKGHLQKIPNLEAILPLITGNIGLVFCKGDLNKVRSVIDANKVAAPARAGSIAPNDVVVPKGNTGLEPTQTSFLQALNIASKITRGQIEIINDVPLIKVGEKVGQSEAALLQKLDIKPFKYGLNVKTVYDNGAVYDHKVLDMTEEDILNKFRAGVQRVAAVGLAIGVPNLATVPHSLVNTYKKLVAIALATDITFGRVKSFKELLANPEALKAAAAAASAPAPAAAGKKEEKVEKKKEEKVEEKAEEEDAGMGGLFGDF
jgi:large subunit ribosomal protein LP0